MKQILDKILAVENKKLDWLDLTFVHPYIFHHNMFEHYPQYYFEEKSGKEHYRLLIFISTLYNNEILFDVGTNRCMSATALSYNKKNKVISYDIKKILLSNPIMDNVKFIIGNVTEDKDLIKSPFIFLDVDHDGIFENILYDHLKNIKWKGLLMLDDIHLNNEMKTFWDSIKQKKYDITDKGHNTGTGLVHFE